MIMTSAQPSEEKFFGRHIRRWRNRRNSSLSSDENGKALSSPTESSKLPRQDLKFPSNDEKLDYDELARSDPQIVSLTFYKPHETSTQLQGVVLVVDGPDGDIVISDFQPNESSFLPPLIQLQIYAGDILESFNGKPCRGCPLDDIIPSISMATGLVTLVLRRKSETTQSRHEICQAMFVTASDAFFPIGIGFKKEEGLLMIDSVDNDDAWMSHSCLSSGQVVLSLNQSPSYGLDIDDAQTFLKVQIDSAPFVSVTSLSRKTQTSSIRRAAVAVGGSAMLGIGAVVMATPLHPLGHALALGGMGVLSTEFEAPRKAVEKAKTSFAGRRKAAEQARKTLRSTMSSTSSQQSKNDDNELKQKDSNDSTANLSSDQIHVE